MQADHGGFKEETEKVIYETKYKAIDGFI